MAAKANGDSLNGMFVALEQDGSVIVTGFTPVSFSVNSGQTYQVLADDYGQYTFSTWSSGGAANPITVVASSGQTTTLTATYTTSTTTTYYDYIYFFHYAHTASATTHNHHKTTLPPVLPTSIATSKLGIIIPMYGNVTSVWQSVINYHQEFPSVPMMMVINPYDGPGKEYNSTFASWVSTLQGDGIPVLGYVSTGYTALPLSQVEAQVSDYVSWYGIHSIFLDDVENVHGYEAYYTSLSEYAHSNGVTYVLGNPGTNVTTSYIGIFDNIGTYENSGAPSVLADPGLHQGWPGERLLLHRLQRTATISSLL